MTAPRQITLRTSDRRLPAALKREAARRGVSVNQLAVELLRRGLGLESARPVPERFDDLDALAGTWTREQACELDSAVAAQRQVDDKLWSR
jgi:hypothetical protein